MATGFELTFEESPKEDVLARVDKALTEGRISKEIAAGAKAVIVALPGSLVSLNMNGSMEPSGYVTLSWHSHSDARDVPTDEERMMPNTEKDGFSRDKAMTRRLGRAPKH